MSGTLNKVILIGHLGRDPEIRANLATFTLATSEAWADRQSGERRQRTEWHHVVIFADPLVEITDKYLRKGSRVYVEGSLQTRRWADQGGQERYTTEIVLGQYNGRLLLLGEPAQRENFALLPDDINLQSSEAEAEEEMFGGDSRPIDGTILVPKITMATIGAAPERCKIAGMPVDCAIWTGQAISIEIHEDPEKRVNQRTGEPLMFEALKGLFGATVLDNEGLPERVYKSDTLYFPINHHLAVAAVKRSGVFNFSFLFTAWPSGRIAGYSWSAKNLSKYDRRMEGGGRPDRAARSDGRRRRG